MPFRPYFHLLMILQILWLTGCASTYEADETEGMSAQEIYSEAKAKLDDEEYESAIKLYEILESRFPYGQLAEQAQLEIAYGYYKYDEPESAVLSAERFIKLHPNHARVDYAYYLRGLASYNMDLSLIYRLFNQDHSERDPKAARRAFTYFSELVKRYPNSRYTPDAIERMHLIRDSLAQYEYHVTDKYIRRRAFVAAANRATYIIENYQGTPVVPDALDAMVMAYLEIGLDDLAMDALKVLKLNYPEHEATKRSLERASDHQKEKSIPAN